MSRGSRRRPRPRDLVQIDRGNPYARLGVSPLASTEEIKRIIDERRREAMAKRLERAGEQFGAEEEEMTRLQQIEKEIGSARARAEYNEQHPLNELLTVQRGPRDHLFEGGDAGGLVTAWLTSTLGRELLLPSPESLAFWSPAGLAPALLEELAPFSPSELGAPNPVRVVNKEQRDG